MTSTTTYTSTMVAIDGFGPFPAMVENERRWNGFAFAWFTWETMNDIAQQIVSEVRDPESDVWIEIEPVSKFIEHGEGEAWPVAQRDINGTCYYMLTGGWCWMEDDADACAACACLTADEIAEAGWGCGSCGLEFDHAEGVHTVQYGTFHEFVCNSCLAAERANA